MSSRTVSSATGVVRPASVAAPGADSFSAAAAAARTSLNNCVSTAIASLEKAHADDLAKIGAAQGDLRRLTDENNALKAKVDAQDKERQDLAKQLNRGTDCQQKLAEVTKRLDDATKQIAELQKQTTAVQPKCEELGRAKAALVAAQKALESAVNSVPTCPAPAAPATQGGVAQRRITTSASKPAAQTRRGGNGNQVGTDSATDQTQVGGTSAGQTKNVGRSLTRPHPNRQVYPTSFGPSFLF